MRRHPVRRASRQKLKWVRMIASTATTTTPRYTSGWGTVLKQDRRTRREDVARIAQVLDQRYLRRIIDDVADLDGSGDGGSNGSKED